MEISDLIRVILRRKWIVVASAIAALVAAYGYSSIQPKMYSAYAIVRVMTAMVGDNNWVEYNIPYTDRLVNTYTTLLGTAPVTTEIMTRLGLEVMPEVVIEGLPNTELLQIIATAEDANDAAGTANTVADIFINRDVNVFNTDVDGVQEELLQQQADQQASLVTLQENLTVLQAAPEQDATAINDVTLQIQTVQVALDETNQELASIQLLADSRQGDIVLVERASVPVEPDSNNTLVFLMLGAVGGGVAGIGLALLLHLLDQRMYTVQEIEGVVKQPVIARIPQITADIPTLFESSASNPEREEIRRLCILLQQQLSLHDHKDQPAIIIMVMGYPDGNEKALIATGLAYAMAETGIKTLLVEGDLVNPSIVAPKTMSRVEDAITEDETISSISVRWRSPYIDLSIMPSLEPVITDQYLPQFYLRLQKEIELARRSYSIVIVSAPSTLASVHSARLVTLADVALVVTQRGISREPLLELVNELRRLSTTKLEFIESNANLSSRIKEYRAYWTPKDSVEKARRSINAFWSDTDPDTQIDIVTISATPADQSPPPPPVGQTVEPVQTISVHLNGSSHIEDEAVESPAITIVNEEAAVETPAEPVVEEVKSVEPVAEVPVAASKVDLLTKAGIPAEAVEPVVDDVPVEEKPVAEIAAEFIEKPSVVEAPVVEKMTIAETKPVNGMVTEPDETPFKLEVFDEGVNDETAQAETVAEEPSADEVVETQAVNIETPAAEATSAAADTKDETVASRSSKRTTKASDKPKTTRKPNKKIIAES